MAGNIKGITIEFNGDTTKLDKALRQVRNSTRDIDKELKQVNTALKFNPTNVDLWRQKQDLLKQKIGETEKNLEKLKTVQAQLDAQGIDKQSEAYRAVQREIITTESKLKNFKKQLAEVGNANLRALSEGFTEVGGKLEAAGQKLTGLSTAAAGVVVSLGAVSYKAGKAADDLNTLSKVTGIGTDELQKYSYAADLVDVSTESIAKANKKLANNAYKAANGSKSQAEAFASLGVSVTDADGNLRDSEDIFQDVITALGSMTNETERDAIAQKLMGKSAAELNPLIEDGGETYKRVSDTLKKYNLDYIDQETLDKANEFNDELDTMKLIGSVALAEVGSKLAGYLAPALAKVVDLVGRFANWLSNLDPAVLTVIGTIAGFIAILAPLLITIGKIATGIGAIIKLVNMASGAVGLLSSGTLLPIIGVIAAVIAIGVLLYKNWDKIKAVAKAVGEKIKAIWKSVKTSVVNAVTALKDKVTGAWKTIKNTVTGLVRTLAQNIHNKWQSIKEKTGEMWTAIKEKITSPFKKAKEKVEEIIQKIKDFFPIKLGNLFKGIKLPHFDIEWSSVTAFGKTIDFPSGFDIEWYKKGGIFSSPSLIGVGEAGSEAVVPLDKFWDKLDAMQTGNVTINVYPSAGMNETELARKVEQALVRAQKQRQKAYGGI